MLLTRRHSPFVHAALLCLLLTGLGIMGSHVAKRVREVEAARLLSLASSLAETTRHELDLVQTRLARITASPALKHGDLEGFEKVLWEFTRADGLNFILTDRDFRQVINTSAPGASAPPRVLDELRALFAGGRPVVTDLRLNRFRDVRQFGVRASVSIDGEIRYILTALIEPSFIQETLSASFLPAGISAGVVDGHGAVLARLPGGGDWVGRLAPSEVRAAMAQADGGVFEFTDSEGRFSLSAFRSIDRTHWKVGVWSAISFSANDRLILRKVTDLLLGLSAVFALLALLQLARRRRFDGELEG